MSLRINDIAPDFTAETTHGPVSFHEWIGDSWAVLFSHPKNFTPVCTTELGAMGGLQPEFEKRGVKIIGISVDPVESHEKWKNDIRTATGFNVDYPLIGDKDLKVAKLYDMLPQALATALKAARLPTTPPCAPSSLSVPTKRSSWSSPTR